MSTAEPSTTEPMSKEQRNEFARALRAKLDSHRDVFVVDKFMFEPQGDGSPSPDLYLAARHVRHVVNDDNQPDREIVKTLSAATLQLMLDYCESDWPMDFVSYCAGIFHGREPLPGECAFDLLPDVKGRLSADRLGFGHIYGATK